MKELAVKSPSFQHNSSIPKKHSCDGEDSNPPLTIEGLPMETKSLALVVDDLMLQMKHLTTGSSGTFRLQLTK